MITALRMRTNSCANRVAMIRAGPVPDLKCRQCGTQLETLGHILASVARSRGNAVTVEPPTFVAPRSVNFKSDLVIQRQGRVLVVDVTVRHEDENNFAMGHNDKLHEYSQLLPQFRQSFVVTDAEVLPIVVGTRGAMPRRTIEGLSKLGITNERDFMDYNAPLRRPDRQPPWGVTPLTGARKLLVKLAARR
ncbi:unnamed protein product [Phaedon cochleariae]|uniref:Uncharacterized protein n=1 Tax=Phaedon cochleariae TaxID=80249 RepID=A0A9N9SMP3_PHACE|nr:unnamed protein product [Phaedon cochleariae]